ncbi:MAG: hypothetical protein ACOX8J_06965 [Candidatus Merdisoma sp.]|jgi:hypothetical protein
MAEYTWAFDRSFLVFLLIAFTSMALAEKLPSLIPMPFIYGVIFILGFAFDLLPKDLLLSANMIAVGTIAFNVLVVHSGTMVNFRLLRDRWRETLLCLSAFLILIVLELLILTPVLGKGLAFLAPGSVVGGGASCAIASRWVTEAHPELAVFPWLIFMAQGLFSVPVVTWALKKESRRLLSEQGDAGAGQKERASGTENGQGKARGGGQKKPPLCMRIPDKYKTTPYFLGSIMIATVLNNILQNTLFSGLNINPNITALLLGILLGSLGLMDKAPLFRSDSYGLLILGLMGLMANTLANTPWQAVVAYIPALLLVFAFSTAVLLLCAAAGARILGLSHYRAAALLMNCMMGFPVNDMLIRQAAALGGTEERQAFLRRELGPVLGIGTMLISNGLSILAVGILVLFV